LFGFGKISAIGSQPWWQFEDLNITYHLFREPETAIDQVKVRKYATLDV